MKQHKKYFFFDIDGTLTFDRGRQTAPHTLECLRRLKENGHKVFIASGRLQADTAEMAARFGIDSFVSDGGNSITVENRILSMKPLPRETCIRFLEQLERDDVPWGVIIENKKERWVRDKRVTQYTSGSFLKNIIDPSFDYHTAPQFFKIFVGCTPEEQPRIDFGSLPVVRFNPQCVYVEPDDKSVGIRAMMQHLNAPLKDVVVFGDGSNDLKMFCPEWFSIAMGNAKDTLKAKADYITADCEADGIYEACRHFGWI